jgi:ADP-ribosylglycohydrolase
MPVSVEPMRAAVYGHLVGDAIGVPYEFTSPDPTRVVELRGGGAHGQPPGTWSDDGALMLALLDSLLRRGFDPEHQGQRAVAWYDYGDYTPDDDGAFDIGTATAGALARLRAGTPAIDAGGTDERDQGNGSLMRILPVALVDPRLGDAEVVERAHLASRVTHGHPNCQVACALYVLVARTLLERPDSTADVEAAMALATDRLLEVYGGQPASASVLRGLLAHRSTMRKPGGGWVLDSFWSAWGAFAASGSYRETIARSVRFGHDTDTTAAIAGGLAGIRWGLDEGSSGIPAEWLGGLRGRDLVERILDRGQS